jgi:hypothetical protein
MNPYMNEDVMWQRLKDLQLEAENRRLYGNPALVRVVQMLRLLGSRAWLLAGLATRRPPRRRPIQLRKDDRDHASDAA